MSLLEPRGSSAGASAVGEAGTSDVRDADGLRHAACRRWSVEREPTPALLMAILDVSGTMAYAIQTGGLSRWDLERAALVDSIGSMPARVGIGVLYFPNMETQASPAARPASACVNLSASISIRLLGSPASPQRERLTRSLAATEPSLQFQGGAATFDAYSAGLEELGQTTIDGSRNLLLVTDGLPTFSEGCVGNGTVDYPVDPGPVVAAIAAARRAGVHTFVIGSPGSERTNSRGDDARPWLSRAAEAGGTAAPSCSSSGPSFCHYDLTREQSFGQAMTSALADIERRITRCDVPLPDPPENEALDPERVNVVFTAADGTSSLVVRDDSPTCSNGWRYSSDAESVSLCDQACAAVNDQVGSKLELVFGCDSVTP